MAVKLLRIARGGEVGHPGWEGWRFYQGKIHPPTGNAWEPWEIEQLTALQRQAQAFRDLYVRFLQQQSRYFLPEPQGQGSKLRGLATEAAANDPAAPIPTLETRGDAPGSGAEGVMGSAATAPPTNRASR